MSSKQCTQLSSFFKKDDFINKSNIQFVAYSKRVGKCNSVVDSVAFLIYSRDLPEIHFAFSKYPIIMSSTEFRDFPVECQKTRLHYKMLLQSNRTTSISSRLLSAFGMLPSNQELLIQSAVFSIFGHVTPCSAVLPTCINF